MAETKLNIPILDRLFRFFFPQKKKDQIIKGSQRSATLVAARGRRHRNWDLEIQDYPIRDRVIGQELIDLWNRSYIARHVLSYAARDTFSDLSGSGRGWTIPPTIDEKGEIPVDSEVFDIVTQLKNRRFGGEYVIGGNRFKPAVQEGVGFGDSFWSMGIRREGGGSNKYEIYRTLKLPPWELFRMETDQGLLLGFEQRRYLTQETPYAFFLPSQMIHFRYEPRNLYGRSIFQQSLEPRADRLEVRKDMARAARASGNNMNLHEFPEGWDTEMRRQYKNDYEMLQADGMITDLFLQDGVQVSKLATINPDLDPLISQDKYLKYEEIPAGFPIWLFPGLVERGAREIAGQPAWAYLRMRNDWCAMISDGIRWACEVEIVLKLGIDRYRQLMQEYSPLFRIVWPEWPLSQDQVTNAQSSEGEDDPDDEIDQFLQTLRRYQKAGGSDHARLQAIRALQNL